MLAQTYLMKQKLNNNPLGRVQVKHRLSHIPKGARLAARTFHPTTLAHIAQDRGRVEHYPREQR